MDHGTDNKVFDVMKVEFRFRLLSCFVPSIDVVHFHAKKPLKMLIPLRLEAKKSKKVGSDFGPESFCRRLLYVLDARCPSLLLL